MKKITEIKKIILKFGSVGFISYLINIITFNILVYSTISPFYQSSKIGTFLAGLLSILVAFLGHKNWTWRDRNYYNSNNKQIILFFMVNLITIIFNLLLLLIVRDILLLKSQLVDNIIINVFGQAIGTIFRFYMYNNKIFKQ